MPTATLPRKVEYPHILREDGDCARFARFPRWRISLLIAEHLAYGWNAEQLKENHQDLTLGEIHSAFAYYYDHQAEIDAEIEQDQQASAEFANRPEQVELRRKLRTRMEQRKCP
ncbi:MAG TPA: hypothetical protein VK137_02270 [Planctomycetaceae bacterium]|nr:hypothetical protein [Planctomycetaceae bacterium]